MTLTIVDAADNEVRRLATGVPAVARRSVRVSWDGRTEEGGRAPEGVYRVRVGLRRGGRAVTLGPGLRLDTTAPRPTVFAGGPDGREWITGPVAGPGAVPRPRRLRALPDARPRAADRPGQARRGERVRAAAGRARRRVGREGRRGTGAGRQLPARGGRARRLGQRRPLRAARPPAGHDPRPAGRERARPDRAPAGRPRAGGRDGARSPSTRAGARTAGGSSASARRKPRRKGRKASGGELKLRAPRDSSGLYVLNLRTAKRSTSVPFAVQDATAAPILVVLPGGHLVRPRHARRRPRRPAQHARERQLRGLPAAARATGCRRASPTRSRRCSRSSTARRSTTTSPPT